MIGRLLFVLSFAGSSALAASTITSVTPNSGPIAGGTRVVIKGTGFSKACFFFCLPQLPAPSVSFGSLSATEVKFIDSTMVEAVTPRSLPMTVSVSVTNLDGTGSAEAANAFTFVGDINDGFEPFLLPIFTRPVFGAFGSEFRTFARVMSIGAPFIGLYGLDQRCLQVFPPLDPTAPIAVSDDIALPPDCAFGTGRIFWTRKGDGASLAMNLRVADVSREATSHGTEIPVVRANEFSTDGVALLGIPTDPRFRITLRIYSLDRTDQPVRVVGISFVRDVHLSTPADNFEPAYAEVSDLPRTVTRLLVISPGTRVWAFITVTNNVTQQITTITPQ
jgi:hypothetical protein